jgi:hypothetical protein
VGAVGVSETAGAAADEGVGDFSASTLRSFETQSRLSMGTSWPST